MIDPKEKYVRRSDTDILNVKNQASILTEDEKEYYEQAWGIDFSEDEKSTSLSLPLPNFDVEAMIKGGPLAPIIGYAAVTVAINVLGLPIVPPFFDITPVITLPIIAWGAIKVFLFKWASTIGLTLIGAAAIPLTVEAIRKAPEIKVNIRARKTKE
jgi:hypothetical protein